MTLRGRLAAQPWALALVVACALRLVTWSAGYALAFDTRAFDTLSYLSNYHHWELDPRLQPGARPEFLRVWAYADAEWYLGIAEDGYPSREEVRLGKADGRPHPYMDRYLHARYAFFPLFPALIALLHTVLPLYAAAFVATLLAGVLAAVVLARLLHRVYPARPDVGFWSLMLVGLFPFSVFHSLYFTEALFLLLSLAAFLFQREGRHAWMALAGGLTALTRPNGVVIVLPLALALFRERQWRGLAWSLLVPLALLPHLWLNLQNMGDPLYFAHAQAAWAQDTSAWATNLYSNLVLRGLEFTRMPFHSFHRSQVDYAVVILFGAAVAAMARDRSFPREWTLWALLLWAVPLVSKDTMSFSRFMSVSFPTFVYAALKLPRRWAWVLLGVFAFGYLAALDAVVRYVWVG